MNNKENFSDSIKDFLDSILGCCFTGGCCLLSMLLHVIPMILIACLVASWLCNINLETTYSWYHGIWHGIFSIPNLIMHFFNSDILFKANHYTSAYNVWWWISSISVLGSIFGIFGGGRR